jgi:hypothetical protein
VSWGVARACGLVRQAERARLRALVRQQLAEVAAVTEVDEGAALLGSLVRGEESCERQEEGRAGQGGPRTCFALLGSSYCVGEGGR